LYDTLIAGSAGAIRGFVCDASFLDIGTVADYWTTSLALAGDAPGAACGERVTIDPTATLTRSIVWDDVDVGAGANLEECVVADGVRVPAGARYRRASLVMTNGALTATPWEGRER
jgi:NDP-sugar pyrophosphorylase family protein